MDKKELTICIPTYNRKERLLKQLESLYRQDRIYDVQILIIDNNSDYNVEETVNEHFGKGKVHNLKVHVNPVNLGLEPNICMPFILAKTKWIWTLGDDDETCIDSIDTILSDICLNPECAGFIYSLEGQEYPNHLDIKHEEIEKFIDYLVDNKIFIGDLVFLSSKVYNLDKIGKYAGSAFRECMNCVGHIVPYFYFLNAKEGYIETRSKPIVKYISPAKGTGWKVWEIAYEFSLMSYMDLDIPEFKWKKFCKYIGSLFSINELVYAYLNFRPKYKGRFYFHEVYNKLLKYYGFKYQMYYAIFETCYFFNWNLRAIVDFVKRKNH